MMNDVLSHLERQLPEALHFLEQMVTMESPSFEKPLVDRLAAFLGERFREIGGQIDVVPAERFGNHLRAEFAGRSASRVLLLGHMDTVWPAGEIQKRPFRIEGKTATGPGVFDMKAGILLMWMALGGLMKVRGELSRPVTVLLTSDEEVGSNSSRNLIESEAGRSRAVLVLEPSLPGGILKTARKGVGRFTVKAIGRAAHAGIDPLKGINAIEEISRQTIKLQAMNAAHSGTTVTVGVVQGGTRSNVVPAEAAIEVDVRVASMEEADRMTRAIRALNPELPGARLEVRGSISRPPMERTADTVRLFEIARSVAAGLGLDLKEGSTGGASDGNLTSALGIPTLDGLGPVGDGAHGVDEHVEIESIPRRAALLAGLIERV
jgi:glutamate carboxypeptidase